MWKVACNLNGGLAREWVAGSDGLSAVGPGLRLRGRRRKKWCGFFVSDPSPRANRGRVFVRPVYDRGLSVQRERRIQRRGYHPAPADLDAVLVPDHNGVERVVATKPVVSHAV